MPPFIAFAGVLGGLAVVRWAYKTAHEDQPGAGRNAPVAGRRGRASGRNQDAAARPRHRRLSAGLAYLALASRSLVRCETRYAVILTPDSGRGILEAGEHAWRRVAYALRRSARKRPIRTLAPIRLALIPIPPPIRSRAFQAPRETCFDDGRPAAHMRPERSFQGFILALQRFWAEQGCVILQPYDMEMGAGTFHPATTLRALGPKPLERGLCAALAAAEGRPLWRKS